MVSPCGMVKPSLITLVFDTELALWITGLLCPACCRDGLGVLFGLGEVNGDIDIPVFSFCDPFNVLFDPVVPDIIGSPGKTVKIIRRLLR